MGLFLLLLRLFFNNMLISENALFLGDIIPALPGSTPDSHRKPVDTPLRETVPRSALTVGVDDLLRAEFFRHVRKAAAPIQDARGRVVERIPCGYEIDGCRIERRFGQTRAYRSSGGARYRKAALRCRVRTGG